MFSTMKMEVIISAFTDWFLTVVFVCCSVNSVIGFREYFDIIVKLLQYPTSPILIDDALVCGV